MNPYFFLLCTRHATSGEIDADDVVSYLLEKKARINGVDHQGYTSFMWAAESGHIKVSVRVLDTA